jgi:hypothetical protein
MRAWTIWLMAASVSIVSGAMCGSPTVARAQDSEDRVQKSYNAVVTGVQSTGPANNNMPGLPPSKITVENNPRGGIGFRRVGWSGPGVALGLTGAGAGGLLNYGMSQAGVDPDLITNSNMSLAAIFAAPAGAVPAAFAAIAAGANITASNWIEAHVVSDRSPGKAFGGRVVLNGVAAGGIAVGTAAGLAATTGMLAANPANFFGAVGVIAEGIAVIPAAGTLLAVGATVGVTAGLIYAGVNAIDYVYRPPKQPAFAGLGDGKSLPYAPPPGLQGPAIIPPTCRRPALCPPTRPDR